MPRIADATSLKASAIWSRASAAGSAFGRGIGRRAVMAILGAAVLADGFLAISLSDWVGVDVARGGDLRVAPDAAALDADFRAALALALLDLARPVERAADGLRPHLDRERRPVRVAVGHLPVLHFSASPSGLKCGVITMWLNLCPKRSVDVSVWVMFWKSGCTR